MRPKLDGPVQTVEIPDVSEKDQIAYREVIDWETRDGIFDRAFGPAPRVLNPDPRKPLVTRIVIAPRPPVESDENSTA